jgi:hypothetical protein
MDMHSTLEPRGAGRKPLTVRDLLNSPKRLFKKRSHQSLGSAPSDKECNGDSPAKKLRLDIPKGENRLVDQVWSQASRTASRIFSREPSQDGSSTHLHSSNVDMASSVPSSPRESSDGDECFWPPPLLESEAPSPVSSRMSCLSSRVSSDSGHEEDQGSHRSSSPAQKVIAKLHARNDTPTPPRREQGRNSKYPPGQSSSSKSDRDLIKLAAANQLPRDSSEYAHRYLLYEQKMKEKDGDCDFEYINWPWRVKCSKCITFRAIQAPFNVSRPSHHFDKCKGLSKGKNKAREAKEIEAGSMLMGNWLSKLAASKKGKAVENATEASTSSSYDHPVFLPCPGLCPRYYKPVDRYLKRTSAVGGGAKSPLHIAKTLFKTAFNYLSDPQKKQVRLHRQQNFTWRNDHKNNTVFASKCTRNASSDGSPCPACMGLVGNKEFRRLAIKSLPEPENMKFNNDEYKATELARLFVRSDPLLSEIMDNEVSMD